MTLAGIETFGIACALLLATLAEPIKAADVNEELFAAVRKGDAAAVKALLVKGADVNAKGPYDQTPIFFAADRGHLEIVKLLVEKGADVNRKDTFYGFTAIARSAMKKNVEIIMYLAVNGATGLGQLLSQAVFGDDKELLKALLDSGKLTPRELTAALSMAKTNNKSEIMEMLKAAGAQAPAGDITLDDAALGAFTGTYIGGRGGTEFEVVVSLKESKLKVELRGQQTFTFAPYSKTEFRCVEQNSMTVEFKIENGKATGFLLDPGAISFTRKP